MNFRIQYKINAGKDVLKFNYERKNSEIVQYELIYDKNKDGFKSCRKAIGKYVVSIGYENIDEEITCILRDIRDNTKLK